MTPVLYSFRRCPYAIRARLAIAVSGVQVELREVVLRDKPQEFLDISPSATVPSLMTKDGVIDESLDIMKWALGQNDPKGWLDMPDAGWRWIEKTDGRFKQALDRTKYANRYPTSDPLLARQDAEDFLSDLNAQIDTWILGRPTISDFAILPFVRQFAFVDKQRFDKQPWPHLQAWLSQFITSSSFQESMLKYAQWQEGAVPVMFADR